LASLAETILAPVREAAGRAGLTDFLGWWRSELAALVPAEWRERFDSSGVAYLSADADAWRALRPVSGSLVEAGRVGLAGLDTAGRRAALRRLGRGDGGAQGLSRSRAVPPTCGWLFLPTPCSGAR
jgi:hypothetical protein